MAFYDLKIRAPKGGMIRMSDYKGKTLLLVNTASKCGLASQLTEIEALYQKYKDKGFEVIAFPSNQFMNQEPETNDNLEQVCRVNFGVSFQLTEKIDVNGINTHPIFKFLKDNLPGTIGRKIKWNYTKFLISSEGEPYKRYAPTTKPSEMEKDILSLINKE